MCLNNRLLFLMILMFIKCLFGIFSMIKLGEFPGGD